LISDDDAGLDAAGIERTGNYNITNIEGGLHAPASNNIETIVGREEYKSQGRYN
jgi:hypothetical protein